MRSAPVFLIAASLASILWSWQPADAPAPLDQEKAFGERYRILIERNIFSRNRPQRYVPPGQAARDRERAESKTAPPPTQEESLVFTGVVRRSGQFIAFIENRRTGATVKTRIGDAIARGKVADISLDQLTYEYEGRTAVLEVGKTLAGTTATIPKPSETKASSGDKAPEAAGSGGAAELLERMRQRRLQEMKK